MAIDENDKKNSTDKSTESKDNEKEATEKLQKESQTKDQQAPKSDQSLSDAQKTVDTKFPRVEVTNDVIGTKNEVITIKSGDKVATIELDGDGKVKSFVDRNGDTIEKRGENWCRSSILNYPAGEPLQNFSVDADHNVKITYQVPRTEGKPADGFDYVQRTIKPNGSESTLYDTTDKGRVDFSKPEYQTSITRDGNTKTLEVIKDNTVFQGATFEGDKLVSFKAPDNSVYTRVSDQPPKFTKSINGETQPSEFIVKCDSDGTAYVRDLNPTNPNRNASLGYAGPEPINLSTNDMTTQRFHPDGTRVNSDLNGTVRTVTAPDGSWVKRDKSNPDSPTLTVSDKNGTVTTTTFKDGQPFEIKIKTGEEETVLTKKENDWVDQGGRCYNTTLEVGKTSVDMTSSNELEKFGSPEKDDALERRTIVQELPENWKELLQQRMQECDKPLYSQIGPSKVAGLKLLYDKTADGGEWDDKQNGTQYEKWGNAAWGMYAQSMDMTYYNAIWWNGMVKTYWNGKNKGNQWGNPIWDDGSPIDLENGKTLGQNPQDARLIEIGYKYYNHQKEIGIIKPKPEQLYVPDPYVGFVKSDTQQVSSTPEEALTKMRMTLDGWRAAV